MFSRFDTIQDCEGRTDKRTKLLYQCRALLMRNNSGRPYISTTFTPLWAYATGLCLSVVVCTECVVAKRCVLEQKLLLTAYRKSYMRNRWVPGEWPWPLLRGHIKVTPTIALHLTLNISETVRDRGEALFSRTTNRKWPMSYQMVTWPMTSRDCLKGKGQTRDPNMLIAQYLENGWR